MVRHRQALSGYVNRLLSEGQTVFTAAEAEHALGVGHRSFLDAAERLQAALHAAQELAGRRPFRRWANGPDGQAVTVAVGGCSRGFGAFAELPVSSDASASATVFGGRSPQGCPCSLCSGIRGRPELTRCDREDCTRCADAIAGGPV